MSAGNVRTCSDVHRLVRPTESEGRDPGRIRYGGIGRFSVDNRAVNRHYNARCFAHVGGRILLLVVSAGAVTRKAEKQILLLLDSANRSFAEMVIDARCAVSRVVRSALHHLCTEGRNWLLDRARVAGGSAEGSGEKHLLRHLTRSSATLPPRAFSRFTET
jgi:hypothetical protein